MTMKNKTIKVLLGILVSGVALGREPIVSNHSKISESIQLIEENSGYVLQMGGLNSGKPDSFGVKLGLVAPNAGMYTANFRFSKGECVVNNALFSCGTSGVKAEINGKTIELIGTQFDLVKVATDDAYGIHRTSYTLTLSVYGQGVLSGEETIAELF